MDVIVSLGGLGLIAVCATLATNLQPQDSNVCQIVHNIATAQAASPKLIVYGVQQMVAMCVLMCLTHHIVAHIKTTGVHMKLIGLHDKLVHDRWVH